MSRQDVLALALLLIIATTLALFFAHVALALAGQYEG